MSRESQVQERSMSSETADSGDSGNGVAVSRRVSSAGVPAKPKRRQFSAEFKARIVVEKEELERKVARLEHRLWQAEKIIEAQKKLSEILGIPMPDSSDR